MPHHLTAIGRALDFVEANLREEIAVADMADAAGYSLYHFCRTFNGLVHHTPYDYLMRRRLSESARDLIATDRRIIDIAFDYRFNSPETFSRAFKRMLGLPPSAWREQGTVAGRHLMPRFSAEYLAHVNKGDYLRPVLQERDVSYVAGITALVGDDRVGIPQLWQMLAQETDGEPGMEYCGIAYYPRDWERRGFFYTAGVMVDSPRVDNPALTLKTIPPSRYARFIHKGPRRDLGLTLDYIYQTWLPRSGERLAVPLEVERFGAGVDDADDQAEWEVSIPIE